MRCPRLLSWLLLLLGTSAAVFGTPEVRVRDVASVLGLRETQLMGMGLVTGLQGKGDSASSAALAETLRSLATSFGLEIPAGDLKSRNCAVVMVSGAAPSFVRAGEKMTVTVSSIGDAKAIEDGVLLATVLRDAEGAPSAVAQGRIQIPAGAKTRTVGSIPGGAVAQRDLVASFSRDGVVALLLRNPDFATARAIGDAIREGVAGASATARDAALVEVVAPAERRADMASFVGEVESVRVKPEPSGRVVIDAARGVVVIGESVRIGRVAVAYRRLSVSVGASSAVSAQGGGSGHETFLVDEPATVADLVGVLQSLELKAEDIIGILQAIDQAGALYGTLVVM